MKLLDVDVVLAAHRDDHPHFGVARSWLDDLVSRREPFSVPDLVAGSFLRLATNRRIFRTPTPIADAFAYVVALRSQPAHVLVAPGSRHLELFEAQATTYDASGDLIPDTQLVALALEHAAEIASFDRDFARFDAVSWVRPT